MDALVTVVIPTHNGEGTVRRAVESACRQTHEQLEVFIVNDGSTDGTLDVASSLASSDPRVRVLSTPDASGGPALPRNLAIERSSGQWIALLDDDDEWAPQKLEEQLDAAGSGTALVYTRAEIVVNGEAEGDYHDWCGCDPEDHSLRALVEGNVVPCLTAMVRRETVDVVGPFDPRFNGVEDYHYWLRVSLAGGELTFCPSTTAVHYFNDGSLTHRVSQPELLHSMFTQLAEQHPARRDMFLGRLASIDAAIARDRYGSRPSSERPMGWVRAGLKRILG